MKRLAIVVHDLSMTGVVRNAIHLAEYFAGQGWDTQLLVHDADSPGRQPEGYEIVPLAGPDAGPVRRSHAMLGGVPALRRHLRRTRPDIVLSAGNHAHLASWAATRGLPGTRLVCRISNDFGHKADGRTRRPLKAIKRQIKLSLLARDADQLVLVSPRLNEEPVIARAGRKGKTSIIRNGVDVERVRRLMGEPCPHPWMAENIPVVLAVGRLAEQKNYPGLIDALAEANTVRPHRLVILGEGSGPARAQLEARATGLGIADRIDFAGTTANPFSYMGRASVFALASWWEGSSNVLLEALAAGTPVVASRTAGNAAEVLDHGRYGVLADPGDAAGLGRAIAHQSAAGTRIGPGERARDFDLQRTLARYHALFEGLAA